MQDGYVFNSQKELWTHLLAGGEIRRRNQLFNPKVAFLNKLNGNLTTATGESVYYVAEYAKWVVHLPKNISKVIAYKKTCNRYRHNERSTCKMKELGIAVRDVGQVVFTTQGSADHEALEESTEYSRAPELDPYIPETN